MLTQSNQHISVQSTTITLPRGTLNLTYCSNSHYQLDDLLGFAERINPKRAFLFVSKVLGRHIPVAPHIMRQAFSDLAMLIPEHLPEPIVVIGMAETAVGLSAGVHQVLQTRSAKMPYPHAILMNSTRHAQHGQLFATFSEDHSHASTHLIYQSDDANIQQAVLTAKTLIMVDDEASTGNTCQNVVQALRQAGITQLQQVHLATLVDWSLGQLGATQQPNAKPLAQPIPARDEQFSPFADLAFFRHHLLSGSWQWTDNPNPAPIHMPDVATTRVGNHPILPTGHWGRMPTVKSDDGLPILWQAFTQQCDITSLHGKKILVLGSNEFVWLPFLLAEKLAHHLQSSNDASNDQLILQPIHDLQALVKFSALTRSPIAVNPDGDTAIKSVLTFADNYGLGMTNFVYNVVPSDWDLIVLCIETPKDSVDPLWTALNNVMVLTPNASI